MVGLIDPAERARLAEYAAERQRRFGTPLEAVLEPLGDGRWRADLGGDVVIEAKGPSPVLAAVRGYRTGTESAPVVPSTEEYRAPDGDMVIT